MTAKIDTSVRAAPPVVLPTAPTQAAASTSPAASFGDPAARRRIYEERVQRWKTISEAGGIDAWVNAELSSKGALVTGDPAHMSDKERGQYKERKKVEAKERRALRKTAWDAYTATHINHLGAGIYWSDNGGVTDKFDIPNREERAKSVGLPAITTAEELAKALEMPIARLRSFAFHREVDTGSHYRRWLIPKRDGSSRTITAPKRDLKRAQRWALRSVFDKLPVHGAAHGFLAARSVVTNAAVHAGADTIVKIDIKDFFPTVTWWRVRGLLRKAGMSEGPATLIALLSTESPRDMVQFRGKAHYVATGPRVLPQGAPTSPAITNAICLRMDRRMSGIARKLGLRYTRYADDLTFSWRLPAKAPEGARPRAPIGALLYAVKDILRAEGFRIHPSKTTVMRSGDRQKVTGLVVNRPTGNSTEGVPDARVPRETVRHLRAAIKNRELGRPGKGETLQQLKGMAAFVFMADAKRGRAFLDRLSALENKEPTEK